MKKVRAQERLTTALSESVDMESRTIFLFDTIDDQSALRFCVALRILDHSPGKITVMLCSGGGDELAGYAIYDAIKNTQNEVRIEGYGKVQSMAAAIFQAGDERALAKECRFMAHFGTIETSGDEMDARTFEALSIESKRQNDRYVQVLAERSGQTEKLVRNWVAKETYFSAQEAVAHGFADEVLNDDEESPKEES